MSPDWDLLKATQESLREHMALCKKKDAAYKKLQEHLETCQDAYDRDMAAWDGRETVLCNMIDERDKEIKILKGYLESCHDCYDNDMAEAEKEIADLKRGFIDVDEAFKEEQ